MCMFSDFARQPNCSFLAMLVAMALGMVMPICWRCQWVGPPLWSRLNYLNKYQMEDQMDGVIRWIAMTFHTTSALAPPTGCHFWLLLKYLDNGWMCCYEIWCRYPWCPDDESEKRWVSPDLSYSATMRLICGSECLSVSVTVSMPTCETEMANMI